MEEKSIDISKYLLHTSQDEEDFNSIHADLSSLTLNDRDNSHLKLITALSFAETSKELQRVLKTLRKLLKRFHLTILQLVFKGLRIDFLFLELLECVSLSSSPTLL